MDENSLLALQKYLLPRAYNDLGAIMRDPNLRKRMQDSQMMTSQSISDVVPRAPPYQFNDQPTPEARAQMPPGRGGKAMEIGRPAINPEAALEAQGYASTADQGMVRSPGQIPGMRQLGVINDDPREKLLRALMMGQGTKI